MSYNLICLNEILCAGTPDNMVLKALVWVNPFLSLSWLHHSCMSQGAHGLSCVPAQTDSLLTMFDPLSSGEGNVNR